MTEPDPLQKIVDKFPPHIDALFKRLPAQITDEELNAFVTHIRAERAAWERNNER